MTRKSLGEKKNQTNGLKKKKNQLSLFNDGNLAASNHFAKLCGPYTQGPDPYVVSSLGTL